MYRTVVRCGCRCVARFCGGVSQPAHAGVGRVSLGFRLGKAIAPLHTGGVRSRSWQRPSSLLLTHAPQLQRQHGPLPSCVATLSSITSPSDLSAAIAAAPSTAALQSLAAGAAATPHQAWLVQQFKSQLIPRLDEEAPVSLIKTLLFFAKMGPGHVELFEKAVPVLYNQLGQMTPADLVDLLSAFSTAAQHSPAAYSQELYAALTEFLWEGLPELDGRGLADVAWGYAAVDHYDDDDDFFAGVAAQALHKLEAFCPDDLARLMLGLSKLRFASTELSTAALKQLAAQLDAWPLSCTGTLLQALAMTQAGADPCILERVANHINTVLRNLRTSTDGKQLLMSLGTNAAAAAQSSSSTAAAAQGPGAASSSGRGVTAAGGATLPGLSGGAGSTRLGPTWQGFGMTRNTSNDTGSTASSSSSGSNSAGSREGAASIFAAASNSSRSSDGYTDSADLPPGVSHVHEQECELGPDYITVTSYGHDGTVTTTYIKKSAANSTSNSGGSSSSNGTPSSSNSSTSLSYSGGNGTRPAPVGRAVSSTSSNRSWQRRSASGLGSNSNTSSGNSSGSLKNEDCPVSWEWQTISSDCRPVYDDAQALQGALVNIAWAFAMLGHVHANMAKECFKALSLVLPEVFSDEQLTMLWAAHMRYQQLGHVMLDPNPLLAESYSVFSREVSRAAPRTISLPTSLQPFAAANWLLSHIRQSPEYQQQQQQQQLLHQSQHAISSWKYRDPMVLTQAGLESSVRQALQQLGLPVTPPVITLDGLERVGLPVKHNGVSIAWQVVPPAWCSRNPPHSPTVDAQMHRWALQYRGYTVLQVPFHEWASVLESGDSLVQAGYLQHLLDGVSSVRAPHVSNF